MGWSDFTDFFTKTIPSAFHTAESAVLNNVLMPVGHWGEDIGAKLGRGEIGSVVGDIASKVNTGLDFASKGLHVLNKVPVVGGLINEVVNPVLDGARTVNQGLELAGRVLPN